MALLPHIKNYQRRLLIQGCCHVFSDDGFVLAAVTHESKHEAFKVLFEDNVFLDDFTLEVD